jgi:predicted short-subunit dehydrogenase-like oxidoreductase (DUF2520 family)
MIGSQAPRLDDTKTVFIAVTDRALPGLGATLGAERLPDDLVVLHSSGSLPSSVLRAALPAQVALGGAHPVYPFSETSISRASRPRGVPLAVEGEPRAVERAEALAQLLEMRAFRVEVAGKTLYHAGLALLSNGAVGLFASAERLLAGAGVDAPRRARSSWISSTPPDATWPRSPPSTP